MHHQLLKMNFSQRKTVLIVYLIDLLFSIASIIYNVQGRKLGIIIYVVLFVIVIWFILHTSIISPEIEKKTKKFESKILRRGKTTK